MKNDKIDRKIEARRGAAPASGRGLILGFAFMLSLGLPGLSLAAQAYGAEELIKKLEQNEVHQSSHSVGSIKVEDRFGLKVSGFESWTQGADKSLIVFTSGDEAGQKILRLKDTLYVAYPEANKPVKIQGSALRDSVAGSDLSYEDMAGDRSILSRYDVKTLGQENLLGQECAVIELRAKTGGLAYPVQKVWVSLKDFSGLKIEKYSQNERLLKTQEVKETRVIKGKVIPVKILMVDHLKGKSSTVFEILSMELDIRIDSAKLSLEELTW